MGDRIVFLGTGGDAIVVGKQYRASGGIVIQAEGSQFHLDPGPGALVMAKMYGINPRETTALLVSHNHITHANDANAVISAMTHNGLDKRGVLITNRSALNGTEVNSPSISHFYRDCVEKYLIVDTGTKIGVLNTDIYATPTKHSDTSGVGFRLIFPRFIVGYTGDTEYTKELAPAFANTDILILNVVNPSGMHDKNNLNSDDAIKLISEVRPRLAILTQFGVKMLQADPLYEAREVQKKTQVHTIAAKDGLTINPVSFASSMRQKSLNSF